jgi:hypothetical protein
MDVEAGVVAAVNVLASHSGSSAAAALLYQYSEPLDMLGPSPSALPPTTNTEALGCTTRNGALHDD